MAPAAIPRCSVLKSLRANKLAGLLLICLLAACQTAAPVQQVAESRWGPVREVAEAARRSAPAIWRNDGGQSFMAWSGTDEIEARLYALPADAEAPVILALGVSAPFDESLYPAAADRYHLLWLQPAPGRSALKLYAATISPQGVAELGPNAVSDEATYRYSASTDEGGTLWIAWSEGAAMTPGLRLRGIDPGGRLRFSEDFNEAGDHPAWLMMPDGQLWLYWLRDGLIIRAMLQISTEGRADLVGMQSTGRAPSLNTGEGLRRFVVAQDETHIYGFWQIVDAAHQPRSLWTSADLSAGRWPDPAPLGLSVDENSLFEAGYNTGSVQAARSGPQALGWFALAPVQRRILPIAISLGPELGLAFLRGGEIVGYQALIETGPLLDAPALAIDAAQDISLAWAEAVTDAPARLRWISTR